MHWGTWKPIYQEILADFGWRAEDDLAAREELRAILSERLWGGPSERLRETMKRRDTFRLQVRDREVWIVGAAATEEDVRAIPPGVPVLVTDGAAHVALPLLDPLAIVTDLDGDVPAQVAANARDVPAFIHAHGDNVEAIRKWVPQFPGIVWGTTQYAPLPPASNHGGFTDGDRAACIAASFGAASLMLVGFDFENPVPKTGGDLALKRRKLRWARRILDAQPIPVRYATSASTHAK